MKRLLSIMLLCVPAFAQRHELGFTLGGLAAKDRGAVESKGGMALQANYGVRVWSSDRVALFGEIHMLAAPLRDVTTNPRVAAATKDYASLYLTPGLRVKLNPNGRVQPYGTIGGGYALYEHSTLNAGGTVNAAPRHSSTGAFQFGGGVDVPVFSRVALRGEIRDFYTGNPAYGVRVSGSQHNLVIGGGFVLRFGK